MGRRLGRGGPILPLPPLEGGPLHRPGVTYSILAGIVLTIATSALLGRETMTVGMAVFIAMILAGVVGLKLES